MGWRALRLALERDGLMKAQARALIEAGSGRTLHVMFPMVSEAWEFDEAKALFEAQRAWLGSRGRRLPLDVRYGAMLEVPALAEQLDLILPNVDFLSIGTNDLTQFLFAADRANPKLAERYDWLSPSILRFLRRVVDPARAAACRRRVRRDGRTAAGGDGAHWSRHRPAVDHPGGGRPGQGDDPLARPGRDHRRDGTAARASGA